MPYRDIVRQDLAEERYHPYAFDAVFVVTWIRCCRCPSEFRAVSRPHRSAVQAIEDALAIVQREGWRALIVGGPVCDQCQPVG